MSRTSPSAGSWSNSSTRVMCCMRGSAHPGKTATVQGYADMADMVTTARKSSVRLLRAFTIGAVIALVATVGLAGLGIHRVYYAHVSTTAEMHAARLADTLVRDGRVSVTPPLVPPNDAGRAALDARLRHDLTALGLAEITLFDGSGRE